MDVGQHTQRFRSEEDPLSFSRDFPSNCPSSSSKRSNRVNAVGTRFRWTVEGIQSTHDLQREGEGVDGTLRPCGRWTGRARCGPLRHEGGRRKLRTEGREEREVGHGRHREDGPPRMKGCMVSVTSHRVRNRSSMCLTRGRNKTSTGVPLRGLGLWFGDVYLRMGTVRLLPYCRSSFWTKRSFSLGTMTRVIRDS